MTITTTRLTRAAGVSAVVSGVLYGSLQFVHPAEEVSNVTGGTWAVVHYLTVAMAVLGLVGITGIYLRQVREMKVLGLVGFVLLALFYLAATAHSYVEAFILPPLAQQSPQVAADILGIFAGTPADGSLGPVEGISTFAFAVYFLGGLTFGAAIFRARTPARWAGILLASGSVSTILLPLLPHAAARFAALPVGIAVAWLGYSLWADHSTRTPALVPGPGTPRADRAAAQRH